MSGSEHDGEAYGHLLAERIIDQARQYGLGSRDMAIMFVHGVDREALMMKAQGISADAVAKWSRRAAIGCRLRISEEGERQTRRAGHPSRAELSAR